MKMGVVVCIHNHPETLQKVQCGPNDRTHRADKVIVAADGSGTATSRLIGKMKNAVSFPLLGVAFQSTICLDHRVADAHDDAMVIEQIQTQMQHPSINLAGQTSLPQLAAIFQRMTCVVSSDNGPRHIAVAMDVPVVANFSLTAPWRTGPYGKRHQVVQSASACIPRVKRHCTTIQGMRFFHVEEVLKTISRLLATRATEVEL